MRRKAPHTLFFLVFCLLAFQNIEGQTTEFTYQGSLSNGAVPANGNHDFEFFLFDSLSGGTQIGATIPQNSVAVANGTFSVKLNFGANFPGANRFLEIRVRQTGGGAFTPLTPRQMVNSSPYSVQSLNAANATQLGGVAANQYVTTTSGNASYIQNQNAGFQSGNFTIDGTGTASVFRAESEFRIGPDRVLSIAVSADNKLFVGKGAGDSTLPGISNATAIGTNATVSQSNSLVLGNNANVGIGTTAPEQTLHVNGLEILSTGSGAGFKFRDRGSTSATGDWVWYSNSNIARFFRAGAGDLLSVLPNGNVGIGTLNPAATLEVNGYTKLGSDAPSIRVKKLTGTTAAAQGENVVIAHGLDPSKILLISVLVNSGTFWVGPGYLIINGNHFNRDLIDSFVRIWNAPGASLSILSKPIKILITYEQ